MALISGHKGIWCRRRCGSAQHSGLALLSELRRQRLCHRSKPDGFLASGYKTRLFGDSSLCGGQRHVGCHLGPHEHYFIKDGIRYHHILDPTTGFPADSGLVSVTIVTPSSLIADALSTGVFVLGLEKGLDLLESLEDVEGILVTNDRKVYATSGLRGRLNGLAKGSSLYESQ